MKFSILSIFLASLVGYLLVENFSILVRNKFLKRRILTESVQFQSEQNDESLVQNLSNVALRIKDIEARFLKENEVLHQDTANLHQDTAQTKKRNIFLIGDSISRHVIVAAMKTANCVSTHSEGWGADLFYMYPKTEQLACTLPSGETIGAIHTYGSSGQGPYRVNPCETLSADKASHCFTSERICKSLDLYTKRVGPPTDIVLALMLWDVIEPVPSSYLIKSKDDEEAIDRWRNQILERIDDIRQCLPKHSSSVRIHLQTTPSIPVPHLYPITYQLNNQLRQITMEQDSLCLIDYDWALHASTPEEVGDQNKEWNIINTTGKYDHFLLDRSKGGTVTRKSDLEIAHLFCDEVHPVKEGSQAHAMHLLLGKINDDGCLDIDQPYNINSSKGDC